MTDAEIAAQLLDALQAAADREADQETALVSFTLEMLQRPKPGRIATNVTRKTRTLAFMSAEFVDEAGVRIATASSVHKVLS